MKIIILIFAILCLVITAFCYFADCTHSMCFYAFLTLYFMMDSHHYDIIDKMKGGQV